jgi:cysteine sulfinate desulfinase/cysteine desulfurase-like protein
MGLSEEQAHCAVRFSLGYDTSDEDVDTSLEVIAQVITETASAIRFVGCR